MRLTNVASIACLVASASAFQYPDFVPLQRRQAPGTPEYNCHANCGGVIVAARTDGYCDTSDFKSELSACLDCALEYDIWKYYGNSVSAAATGCGLDATPVETSSSSSSSSSSTGTTTTEAATTTDAAATTTTTNTSAAETTTAAEESSSTFSTTTSGSTLSSSSAVSSPPLVTSSPTPSRHLISGPSSTPSPSSTMFEGGASITSRGGLVLGVIAGSFVAAFL